MANFLIFSPMILAAEGGYQNLPGDRGNYNSLDQNVGTNRGIAAPTYESIIGRPPTVADMKAITEVIALDIYKRLYWNKLKADQINDQNVANILVDHAVNAGVSRAGKLIQETLNDYFSAKLSVDGVVGNLTINAINSVNGQLLFQKIKQEREYYYRSIGGEFLRSWLNRLNEFAYQVYEKKKK